jgi:uncharacterized DUF497 family protein
MKIHFEWGSRKAALNMRKHGVSFEEARTVFFMKMQRSSMIQTIRRARTALSSWASVVHYVCYWCVIVTGKVIV